MIRKCGQWCITSRLGAITQVLKMLYLDKQCHLEVPSTLPVLFTKQVRWQDVVAISDVNIQHKHGKENVVPNALNKKHQIRLVYVGKSKQKNIQEASQCDKLAKQMMGDLWKGVMLHFQLQEGLFWYKQNWLYVSKGKLINKLLKECHDGLFMARVNAKHTTTLLKKPSIGPTSKMILRRMSKLI